MAYLYHYTNNISLIKILVSQTFKFGHLQNTNDPCERLENRFGLSGNYSSIIDKYLDQLCDFYNKKTSIACFGVKNGNISADLKWTMWANYSYKSTGACMVFDKNKFINVIKQEGVMPLEKRIKYNLGSIRFNLTEQIIDLPHKDFLTKYQDKLLFSKHKDWSYEKEFRIVVFEENFKIPITHCLEKVFYGPEIDQSDEECCKNLIRLFNCNIKNEKLKISASIIHKPLNCFPD